jgi:hypothetical protein
MTHYDEIYLNFSERMHEMQYAIRIKHIRKEITSSIAK